MLSSQSSAPAQNRFGTKEEERRGRRKRSRGVERGVSEWRVLRVACILRVPVQVSPPLHERGVSEWRVLRVAWRVPVQCVSPLFC